MTTTSSWLAALEDHGPPVEHVTNDYNTLSPPSGGHLQTLIAAPPPPMGPCTSTTTNNHPHHHMEQLQHHQHQVHTQPSSTTPDSYGQHQQLPHPSQPLPHQPPPHQPPPHDFNRITSTTSSPGSPDSLDTTSSANDSSANKRNKKGQPYIPSYMDLSNGPEPCAVCADAATGYHYRCMTCEGCKGFFRRTIQKNLKYHCKWSQNCVIDKTTRNQCQQCRYIKCINVGMAVDLVLNEKQRVAKRRLIEENRERRKVEHIQHLQSQPPPQCTHDGTTHDDRQLISDIMYAYEQTAAKQEVPYVPEQQMPDSIVNKNVWQQLAEVMTPSIVKVVEFAKRVTGFVHLNVDDQILLLKSCCMEIMCLRAACRYDMAANSLVLQNGLKINRCQLGHGGLGIMIEPIFEFAQGLAKLQLDHTEVALLAAVLLMQSDRTGLKEPEAVEKRQDAILGAYKRYIAERRPQQPVHWAKILMKVTDLRTISTRHAERVLCIKLDNPGDLPPLFLEMFDEGDSTRSSNNSTPSIINNMPNSLPSSPLGSNPSVVNSPISSVPSPFTTDSGDSGDSSSPLSFIASSQAGATQTKPSQFKFPPKACLKPVHPVGNHEALIVQKISKPVPQVSNTSFNVDSYSPKSEISPQVYAPTEVNYLYDKTKPGAYIPHVIIKPDAKLQLSVTKSAGHAPKPVPNLYPTVMNSSAKISAMLPSYITNTPVFSTPGFATIPSRSMMDGAHNAASKIHSPASGIPLSSNETSQHAAAIHSVRNHALSQASCLSDRQHQYAHTEPEKTASFVISPTSLSLSPLAASVPSVRNITLPANSAVPVSTSACHSRLPPYIPAVGVSTLKKLFFNPVNIQIKSEKSNENTADGPSPPKRLRPSEN